jgi:heparan-alpha-glucosaminide N-acetyltransferase
MDNTSDRLLSLDAYRGFVLLLLLPDVFGGFSFYEMARRFPDSPVWTGLARLFTHVQWTGCSIWDLVFPSFLFMVGVALPYSYAARKNRGQSDTQIRVHAVLRALALLMLGVVVQIPIRTAADMLWPFVLLAFGLPISRYAELALGDYAAGRKNAANALWWTSILLISAIHLYVAFDRIGDLELHDVLPLIAISYLFAFPLVDRSRAVQGAVALAILFLYWLAFLIYPLPPHSTDLAQFGITPGDQVFQGYFAHWNKGTNVAAAFDVWFLNLFPRTHPYVFNPHGYQTLNFVPSISAMIFGVMAGDYLRSEKTRTKARNGLLKSGGILLVAGGLAGWLVCPIVKSISTPSWVLFSTGWVLLVLATFYHVFDVRGHRAWAFALVILGANSILLYVLALKYRWWIVEIWHRVLGTALFQISWAPVLESLLCGFSLWCLALALYRLKLFVRF